jgi:hypothetical protein
MKFWTTWECRQLYLDWQRGVPLETICLELGRTTHSVRQKLKEAGVLRSGHRPNSFSTE